MKGRFWLSFVGLLLLLVGCSGNSNDQAAQPSTDPALTTMTPQETFARTWVNPAPKSGVAPPVPGLLQPTNAKTRANAIAAGRPDPFAAIPGVIPIRVTTTASMAPPKPNAALPTSAVAPGRLPTIPLPPVAISPLPTLPTAPMPTVSGSGAAIAPPSRTSLAESVQVSGVVQVAGRWSVIVRESTASSSRYVAVGEYVENGKVLVKKIVAPHSTEPVVVLQQDGVEIRKSLV